MRLLRRIEYNVSFSSSSSSCNDNRTEGEIIGRTGFKVISRFAESETFSRENGYNNFFDLISGNLSSMSELSFSLISFVFFSLFFFGRMRGQIMGINNEYILVMRSYVQKSSLVVIYDTFFVVFRSYLGRP